MRHSRVRMAHLTELQRQRLPLPGVQPLVLGHGIGALAMLLDAVIVIAISIGTGVAYHIHFYGMAGSIEGFAAAGSLTAMFYVVPRYMKGHYDADATLATARGYRQSFYFWNFAFFCLLTVAFMAKLSDAYSRGAILMFYAAGFAGLTITRAILSAILRRGFSRGWLATRRIWLVGTRERIEAFIEQYAPREHGLQIAGTETLPDISHIEGADVFRPGSFRPRLTQTIQRARTGAIDDIVLLVPWSDQKTVKDCADALMTVPASIHLGPEQVFEQFNDVRLTRIGSATGLNFVRPPLSLAELAAKRALDIVVAATALILLSPLLLLVALAIRLDSRGPILFRQRRHGFNQSPFRILKFRTMTTMDDGPIIVQATRDDARVTRVGRFLRRWNIDELPQLLNVLRGDMSIVGPRPHAVVHNDEYERRIALYARRHNVKPGITGWAQVNGLRGNTDSDEKMQDRVAHDLFYIDNWSLWFDLSIITLTLISPRSYRNAY